MKISEIDTQEELACFFKVLPEQLDLFLNNQENFIDRYNIPGKTGKLRKIIQVHDDSYRHLLKKISDFLYLRYSLHIPKSVHGFIKGRSILSNAQQHTQKKIVVNVDIENFFETISLIRVNKVFLDLGFKVDIANALGKLVTVDGVLATGFSTSPTISNITCLILDGVCERVFEKDKITYTRYADDISLSSDSDNISLKLITRILETNGFVLNKSKCRIYRKGGPQYVTGLTVADSVPRISKRLKKSLRLEMYYIKKYGQVEHIKHASIKPFVPLQRNYKLAKFLFLGHGLEGFISYIFSVEKTLGTKLFTLFSKKKSND